VRFFSVGPMNIEQAAQVMNVGDIVKKKDFTAWVARIVLSTASFA
jgi:hypothetical protein